MTLPDTKDANPRFFSASYECLHTFPIADIGVDNGGIHISDMWHGENMTASPSWICGPLLGFDTETTGVDPTSDRLVTAALITRRYSGDAAPHADTARTWIADPGIEIPAAAAAVHGMSTEFVREHGQPSVQVLEEVAAVLSSAMATGTPVVAFNASYDLTLLEHELVRHSMPTLTQRLGHSLGPVIDPLVLDRTMDRYRKGKRRLDCLCEVYGVEVDEAMHAADVDVRATLDVLEALVRTYPQLGEMSLEELHHFQAHAHRQWAHSFNDWLRSRGKEATVDPSWPLASHQR